jgi:hypothetical protein
MKKAGRRYIRIAHRGAGGVDRFELMNTCVHLDDFADAEIGVAGLVRDRTEHELNVRGNVERRPLCKANASLIRTFAPNVVTVQGSDEGNFDRRPAVPGDMHPVSAFVATVKAGQHPVYSHDDRERPKARATGLRI